MKIKIFEEFTSATGGNAGALTGGEVYSMPNSLSQTVGPSSIGSNIGGTNMNNADISDEPDMVEEDDTKDNEEIKKKSKKSKIKKQLDKNQEQEEEIKQTPVMNWNTFVKKNINKIGN